MKNFEVLLFSLLLGLLFVSCELDERNDMLSAGFQGALKDAETNEIVTTDYTGNRALLYLLDEEYGKDAQKISYNILPEGTFKNTKIYPSTYTIYAKGPFFEVDTLKGVKLYGFNNFDVKVKPYLTLKIVNKEVVKGKMRVTFSYKLNTDDPNVSIKEVNLYYGKFKFPGDVDVDGNTVFKIQNNPSNREGQFTNEFYLIENTVMHVRAGGTVNVNSDYYNYSESFLTPEEFEPATEEKMDESNWKVHEFSSEEPAEGGGNGLVKAAFDNNFETYWHSAWENSSPNYPHHFSVDIEEVKEVVAFECTRRKGDDRGPTKIQFMVSEDGTNWIDLGEFNFDGNSDKVQRFEVAKTRMQYFKYVALEGPNNFAFLSEIDIYVSR